MSHAKSVFEEEPKLLSIAMEDRSHTYLPRVAHSHADRAEILYVRGGNGMHVVDGKAYKTGPGNILIYNAGVLHDEQADSSVGMDIISCAFSVKIEGLPPNCVTPREWCPVLQNDDYASEIEAVMTALYSAFKNGDKLPAEVRQPLLNSFLLIVRRASRNYSSVPTMKGIELSHRIQLYLDEHFKESITLEDIAAATKLSPYYLSHVFKRAVGYSPMRYVIRRRIGEAQSMLLFTDKTVAEIAYTVGYNSASNFNNAFRDMIGMTPQSYRETWKGIGTSLT